MAKLKRQITLTVDADARLSNQQVLEAVQEIYAAGESDLRASLTLPEHERMGEWRDAEQLLDRVRFSPASVEPRTREAKFKLATPDAEYAKQLNLELDRGPGQELHWLILRNRKVVGRYWLRNHNLQLALRPQRAENRGISLNKALRLAARYADALE